MKKSSVTERAFVKLGREKLLHGYCDSVYKMMGLPVDFISSEDETLRLSGGTHFNPYCSLLRSAAGGYNACWQCDKYNARLAAEEKKSRCYCCHAGLFDVVVPLFDSAGDYLGCLTTGQFLLKDRPKETGRKISARARQYGLNARKLSKFYAASPVLTEKQLDGVTQILEIIGAHLTGLRENLIFLEKVNTPDKLEAVRKYIEKNYMKRLTVEQTAKALYLSSSFISHEFSKFMHVSFVTYLNSFRLAKTREMLAETNRSVSEIAFLCGFGSISQFQRLFRAETGMSPKEYRKKA